MREVGTGEQAVAHAERHRRHVLRARLFRHIAEGSGVELKVAGHLDAEVGQGFLVVVHLDRPGLERQAMRLALVGPDLLRPRLDRRPVERRKIEQQGVFHVLHLVGLCVEDVGRGAGAQRRLQRGVERGLFIPLRLHFTPGFAASKRLMASST